MGDVRNANLVRGAANLGANGLVRGAAGFLGLTPVGVGINEAINLAFPPEAKGELPVGTRGADGKFWTGSDYGWQSGASAVKAGLLPSEAVGSTATGQAFGVAAHLKRIHSLQAAPLLHPYYHHRPPWALGPQDLLL